jgi:hypothetical protein
MSVEEARALMTEAVTGLDRNTLLAERAEAEAQLRAAEATLQNSPTAANGESAAEQEPDEAAQKIQSVDAPLGAPTLDVVELRRAATAARAADDALARAASEAAERPPGADPGLGTAESAFARALELREELPAAWRRLVGALISATGMAIVIGALGWNVYWLLVPIALIAILTVDLRLAGRAAREASAEAAGELSSVGADGPDRLDRIRLERARLEEAEARLAAARADRDAAYARFEYLAPGRLPSEVEDIIADHHAAVAAAAAAEAEAAARRAAADAGRLLAEALAQDEAGAAPVVQATAAPAAPEPAEAGPPETAEPGPSEAVRAPAEAVVDTPTEVPVDASAAAAPSVEAAPAGAPPVEVPAAGPPVEVPAEEAAAHVAPPGPQPAPDSSTTAT